MFRSLPWMFTLLIPAIFGCNPEDPCSVAATVEPLLEIGVGEKAFRSIDTGDTLQFAYGNQGGQHVWVAVHTEGVATGRKSALGKYEPGPTVLFTLMAQDNQIGEGFTNEPLDGDEMGAELAGQELYLDWWDGTLEEPGIDTSNLLIRAELTDKCGVQLVDERAVRADL